MNPVVDADLAFIAEALPVFVSEAHEQIAAMESLLLQLESAPADAELLGALFRCAHTVKGSAGMFGLDALVAFTHQVETLLDHLRDGGLAFDATLGTLLLACNDEIRRLVERASDEAQGGSPTSFPAHAPDARRDALVARLQAACGALSAPTQAAAPAARALTPSATVAMRWRVEATFGPDTFRDGIDPATLIAHLARLGAVGDVVCDRDRIPPLESIDPETCHLGVGFTFETDVPRERIAEAFAFVGDGTRMRIEPLGEAPPLEAPASPAAASQATEPPPPAREAQRFIRVQADRLDEVITLLGELVIASAGAEMLARQSRQGPQLEANRQITALVEEIRNGTLQLRMVPIGETFARFRRTVRDTAGELGKDVALEIVGGDTELDKSVVERIADPLMHLVRNALDHGLETPSERTAAGKPPRGRLSLSACHDSGGILIRLEDDGRGIDRDRVLAKARDQGLVEPGRVLTDAQVLGLIFQPGFSTAARVTELSGRGVGMDVVQRSVEALRGSITVTSEPGRGTRIEVRLPLTLAIIDGFLVRVGAARFIFPLGSVVEVVEHRPAVLDDRGCGLLELRGQALPVVCLRALYALDGARPGRISVVVVQTGTHRFGVIVDALLGQHQTVIKPLSPIFRSLRGLAGSSILGDGAVALICDVNALCGLACGTASPHPPSRIADADGGAAPTRTPTGIER